MSVNGGNRIVTSGNSVSWPGLDELDFRIIALLQADGRASFARMSQSLGSAVATVRQRYERLVREGYVHTVALVDPATLGRAVVAHVEVTTYDDAEKVAQALLQNSEIAWLGIGLDYETIFIQLSTSSHAALVTLLNEQIRTLPGVKRFSSSIQLRSWSPMFRFAGSTVTTPAQPQLRSPWAGGNENLCLDAIDRGLLECLEQDARMTVTAMTERVGLSVPAARQRLVKLLSNGIARIRVRPNPLSDKIIPIRLNIEINRSSDEVARSLAKLPHVTYIMESTGPAMLRMEVLCLDESHIAATYRSARAIPGVVDVTIVRYSRVVAHTGHW